MEDFAFFLWPTIAFKPRLKTAAVSAGVRNVMKKSSIDIFGELEVVMERIPSNDSRFSGAKCLNSDSTLAVLIRRFFWSFSISVREFEDFGEEPFFQPTQNSAYRESESDGQNPT